MKLLSSLLILLSTFLSAQVPEPAFQPMTANGARHILADNQYIHFKLFWKNPLNVTYNDIYLSPDSSLVINMDPSALVVSGNDSLTVFDSLSLGTSLDYFTKYYWRVVEQNSSGYTAGPVWHFITMCYVGSFWQDDFSGNLSDYTIIGPSGSNWNISYTNHSGGQVPELSFDNYGFSGTSYLILNRFFDLTPSYNPLSFNYGVTYFTGEFTIGVAYSSDEGITWTPLWQQDITGSISATQVNVEVPNENYIKLALFVTNNNSNSVGSWYIDNLLLSTPLTVSTPPHQIRALSSTDSLKVSLSWDPGYTVNPSWGYRLQRKNGLPINDSPYYTIANVDPSVLSYEDYNVQLDSIYSYRIQGKEGPGGGWHTVWSNDATAYVPYVTPVEFSVFYAAAAGNGVDLSWTTATEKNNMGFEIQRKQISGNRQNDWEKIGYIKGNGTSIEIHSYSYTDEKPGQGKFQYRLKQIDFSGSFEYSGIADVTIGIPNKFSLSQNYPNPFNPTTRIEYQVPEPSKVIIKVYDALGREIKMLVNEEIPAGNYNIEFNAEYLPSGIYFYRLTSGSFSQVRKMILMR